jgi:hypothetical protein
MRSLDSWMVGSLIRKSPMKKLATALALALAFAAPMAFSTSGAQASTVNSQSHMTKSMTGKHQAVKSSKKKVRTHKKRTHRM